VSAYHGIETICIVCDETLVNIMGDYEDGVQPDAGTSFSTYGHYGSTITDFMDGTVTTICVCDVCLSEAILRKAVWFKGKSAE